MEMNREDADKIHSIAIEAITNLTSILERGQNFDEYEKLKKGVGLSIGSIQMNILEVLYRKYPELDDLK